MIDQQAGDDVVRIEPTGGFDARDGIDGLQVGQGAPFCHCAIEFRHISAERPLVGKPHHLRQALGSDLEIELRCVSAVLGRR